MNKVVRSDADDGPVSTDATAASAACAGAGPPRAHAALAPGAPPPRQVQPAEQPRAREEEGTPL